MSHDDTRTRIIEAAGSIFAEKGFNATTVREICKQAGVNLAGVNYHFGSKECLYLATVELAHPNQIEQPFTPEWPEGTPAGVKLRGFVRAMLSRLLGLKATAWQWRLLLREIIDPTPMCRDLLRDHFRAGFAVLDRIIDEAVPPEMAPHRRHQIALSVVAQCVYYRSAANIVPLLVGEDEVAKHYGIEDLTEHITRFSLAALGLAPPIVGHSDAQVWKTETVCHAN